MTWTHEESRLREPADGAAGMCAIDGKNPKRICGDMAHPAGGLVGGSVPGMAVGVAVRGEARFANWELIDRTKRYPGIIGALATGRAEQIAHDGSGDRDSNNDIEECADLEQQPAARNLARVVASDLLFLLYDVRHNFFLYCCGCE